MLDQHVVPALLRRVDPARNMARYYGITVEPTLFGWSAVVRDWGRIGRSARRRLDHGYDENKPADELDLADMQRAAAFRGGSCESPSMRRGDLFTPLGWRCAFGHAFAATPNLVLKGGHWCAECAPPGWNYARQARRSPFFAQVWYPNHGADEDDVYPRDCVRDIARS